jgi:hypothetical protein
VAKNDNLEKKTLYFREGDWAFLESMMRPNGIATSVAIRSIVSKFVDERRERQTPINLELETDL